MSPLRLRTALRLAPGLVLVCGLTAWAADATKKSPPPKFDAAAVDELFFKDARQQLIGAPPTAGGQVAVGTVPGATMAPGGGTPAAAASSDGNAWSAIVSGDTLESEIKAQARMVARLRDADRAQQEQNLHDNMLSIDGPI